jgi:hypothetical protein
VLVARCAVPVGGGVLEVPSVVETDNGTQRYQVLVLSKPSAPYMLSRKTR